jgi:hypothetical protein
VRLDGPWTTAHPGASVDRAARRPECASWYLGHEGRQRTVVEGFGGPMKGEGSSLVVDRCRRNTLLHQFDSASIDDDVILGGWDDYGPTQVMRHAEMHCWIVGSPFGPLALGPFIEQPQACRLRQADLPSRRHVVRRGPVVEALLDKDEIEPSAELGTYLRHAGDLDEAKPLVKKDRGFVLTGDGPHHDVFVQ